MKVKNYRVGRRNEKEFTKMLENKGYSVWKPPIAKFQSRDIFGIFDMIAIRKKTANNWLGDICLIQVKSNKSGFYSVRKKILTFKHLHEGDISYVIALKEKTTWRIFYTKGEEEKEIYV